MLTLPSVAARGLAHQVTASTYGSLTRELVEAIRLRVFDLVGAIAAGLGVAGTDPRRAASLAADGTVGSVRRLCAAARSTEIDDIDLWSCTTPGSVAVPVALALGAAVDAVDGDVLAAVAAGYEAMVAVGDAIEGPRVLYTGVWPSYVAAPVAAAATAASLLGLGMAQTSDALALAAARAGRTVGRPDREPTSRWFLYGCAAADGVLAALAARDGLAGDGRVLDALLSPEGRVEIGRRNRLRPAVQAVDAKPFCTARQTQPAVEAARAAVGELHGTPDTIEVRVPEAYRAMVDRPLVSDRLGSIASAQFQIAAALTQESLLFDVRRSTPRLSAPGEALAQKITVRSAPELDALYPEIWPVEVRVRAVDGAEATHLVRRPNGSGEPSPGWDWLVAKHTRLGSLGERLAAAVELCQALGGPARGGARALLQLAVPPRAA
jgi:2-methylcitrate dehydratase PrpD